MGAIKLPVRVDTVSHLPRFFVLDADNRILCIIDSSEEANEVAAALNERPALIAERDGLLELLEVGRLVVGEHFAPNDCYATGPRTGNPIADLIVCPSCNFLALYEQYKARRAALRTGGK